MQSEAHQHIDVKSLMSLFACFVFVWCGLLSGSICQAAVPFFNAKVIRVIDGDTIEIQQETKIQRVRIWGIDTPERDQSYARPAHQFTRSLLAGREVKVLPKYFDCYGRLVAIIIVDEKNISEELVRSGLAWVHIYYCNELICDNWKSLQERAMFEHRGLWNDRHPVAPWQWKKNISR
jgi:micrococcal nuclease